jgi:DNA-binding HxlR family transcriptional regulator
MLSTTLKTLEADGLVKRKIYPVIPPKVEYQLTERGKSLMPHLQSLVSWAIENFDEIKDSRETFQS